jgi:hypothetical protein
MFSTQASSSPKKYVPVELRPKEYSFGGDSPRARRFVANIRQLVVKERGKDGQRLGPTCNMVRAPDVVDEKA